MIKTFYARIGVWLLVATPLVLLAACGSTDPAPAPATAVPQTNAPAPTPQPASEATTLPDGVRPIDDILVTGPSFPDPGPESATLLLETNIDVACSAVYGKTTDYGSIAVDNDMTGGGHRDHHPLLTGLEPDTEYHVRLQGVGPDGTIYRSEDYTFRTALAPAVSSEPAQPLPAATPPVSSGKPSGDNLALAKMGTTITGVSSNYGGGDDGSTYGANMAIDGNSDTEWSSDGNGDEAWIEMQLPERALVKRIGLRTRTMGSSAQVFAFSVVTDLGKTYDPFEVPDASEVHYYSVSFTATTLRFEVEQSNGGNTGALEIEVYGDWDPEM
jgi:hypothetical protein